MTPEIADAVGRLRRVDRGEAAEVVYPDYPTRSPYEDRRILAAEFIRVMDACNAADSNGASRQHMTAAEVGDAKVAAGGVASPWESLPEIGLSPEEFQQRLNEGWTVTPLQVEVTDAQRAEIAGAKWRERLAFNYRTSAIVCCFLDMMSRGMPEPDALTGMIRELCRYGSELERLVINHRVSPLRLEVAGTLAAAEPVFICSKDTARDAKRWKATLQHLGGSVVQNDGLTHFGVRPPSPPLSAYKNTEAEFIAAIDQAIDAASVANRESQESEG